MILLLDTTTNPAAIGLWDGKKLKTKAIESTPKNNGKLIGTIKKFIEKEFGVTDDSPSTKNDRLASVTPKFNIRIVGIVNGPGAFTGVRAGVTIANTIGYALKIPVYAIDTLTAQAPRMINNIVSLLSASNNEVYFARFKKGKIQGKIELIDTINLLNRLNDGDIAVGDLGERHCGLITKQEFVSKNSAERIKNLLDLVLCKKIKPVKQVLPLYIKKPNITIKKKLS